MRVVVAALLIAALAAGCDDEGQNYSAGEAKRAFHSHGFEMVAPNRDDFITFALDPKSGDQVIVAVYGNEERAKKAENTVFTLGNQSSSATFNLRKGNVVVTAEKDASASVRKRIRLALASLR